jgi:hypothetical protein
MEDNRRFAQIGDPPGRAACEAVNALAILGGLGWLALRRAPAPEQLWIAGLAAGAAALAAGLFHAARLRRGLPGWPDLAYLKVLSLALQTGLTGACLLLAALVSCMLRRQPWVDPGLLQIYLSAPAILVWTGGQALLARPLFFTRPRHVAQAAALAGRGLLILAGLLLWTYLGLSAGAGSLAWMFWASVGLAGVGLILALSNPTLEESQ